MGSNDYYNILHHSIDCSGQIPGICEMGSNDYYNILHHTMDCSGQIPGICQIECITLIHRWRLNDKVKKKGLKTLRQIRFIVRGWTFIIDNQKIGA